MHRYNRNRNELKYILGHIFGSSWRRRFPWWRSQSLDPCGAGSVLCNTAHLQGTGPGTGPGSALWPLGTHTQLTSLNKNMGGGEWTLLITQLLRRDRGHLQLSWWCSTYGTRAEDSRSWSCCLGSPPAPPPERKPSADFTSLANSVFLVAERY